jgi:hypothetical protein
MYTCFQTAYNPNLMYHTGLQMAPRPSDMLVHNFDTLYIEEIKHYEHRVMDAIDVGFVKDVSVHSSAHSPCQKIINIHTTWISTAKRTVTPLTVSKHKENILYLTTLRVYKHAYWGNMLRMTSIFLNIRINRLDHVPRKTLKIYLLIKQYRSELRSIFFYQISR